MQARCTNIEFNMLDWNIHGNQEDLSSSVGYIASDNNITSREKIIHKHSIILSRKSKRWKNRLHKRGKLCEIHLRRKVPFFILFLVKLATWTKLEIIWMDSGIRPRLGRQSVDLRPTRPAPYYVEHTTCVYLNIFSC